MRSARSFCARSSASISIGAYVPPDETIGGVLACAFAIQLGQSTEAAIALAMPIATLCLAIKNVVNAGMPLLVDRADVFASKGNLKGIYAMHWIIGLVIVVLAFILCSVSFYLGADAVQGLLDFIPTFVLDGFGVAANILPAMGFAMLGRLVLTIRIELISSSEADWNALQSALLKLAARAVLLPGLPDVLLCQRARPRCRSDRNHHRHQQVRPAGPWWRPAPAFCGRG